MKYRNDLTSEYVRSILDYDPETGVLKWKVTLSKRAVAGKTAGSIRRGYVVVGIGGVHYQAHRLAYLIMTGEWPPDQTDHNGLDRSDNRWEKIRPATASQNSANVKAYSTNKSGCKGVSWCKCTKKWRATLTVKYKHICLGRYGTIEEAAAAYARGATEYFGEFARGA